MEDESKEIRMALLRIARDNEKLCAGLVNINANPLEIAQSLFG